MPQQVPHAVIRALRIVGVASLLAAPALFGPGSTPPARAAHPEVTLEDALRVIGDHGLDCVDITGGAESTIDWWCYLNMDCGFSGDAFSCSWNPEVPHFEALMHVPSDDAVLQGVSISAEYGQPDASADPPADAEAFFTDLIELACPLALPAAAAWFDAPVERAEYPGGEGCAAYISLTLSGDGAGAEYDLDFGQSHSSSGEPIASAQPPQPSSTGEADGGAPSAAPAPAVPADAGDDQPFAASIPAPAEISIDPTVLLQSAALAALLVFLMPFPSQLFNSTLETHEDEVRRWFRLDRIGSVVGGIGAFWSSWPGVVLFTALAALLYGFLDPGFGFGLDSLATFVGMLVGIVLVTVAFAIPLVLAHRRHGERPSLKVVPVSLLIGVACVLLSRLTDFQPGYLYGLLIGLAFARELSAAEEGRASALGAGLMLVAAFVSWLGLGALPDGDGFGLVVGRTALAALMVAGLEGVVFGLLPMRFLPGEPLYRWNRVLWAGLLLIGAFAFFHILINPASGYLSDTSRTPLLTVVGLLVGFSLISVAFWAWFRYRSDSAEARA